MSRLTRDGTAESVSQHQILMREIFISPVQLTTYRIGNLTRLIHTLATCVTIHTYHTYILPVLSTRPLYIIPIIVNLGKKGAY